MSELFYAPREGYIYNLPQGETRVNCGLTQQMAAENLCKSRKGAICALQKLFRVKCGPFRGTESALQAMAPAERDELLARLAASRESELEPEASE